MSSGRDTAVVVEVGWVNALATIRSLGRHGLRGVPTLTGAGQRG